MTDINNMISKEIYEVLFYQTDKEFILVLDGPSDPNEEENIIRRAELRNFFKTAELKLYIKLLLLLFKDEYPNIGYLKAMLVSRDRDGNVIEIRRKNKDIKNIHLDHTTAYVEYFEYENNCLTGTEFIFEDQYNDTVQWVEEGLSGKSFTKEENAERTSFTVENSPIKKVTATPNSINIALDKDRFVFYP